MHMYFRTQYVIQLCGNGTTVTEILQIQTLISVPKRKYFIHILKNTHSHMRTLTIVVHHTAWLVQLSITRISTLFSLLLKSYNDHRNVFSSTTGLVLLLKSL